MSGLVNLGHMLAPVAYGVVGIVAILVVVLLVLKARNRNIPKVK